MAAAQHHGPGCRRGHSALSRKCDARHDNRLPAHALSLFGISCPAVNDADGTDGGGVEGAWVEQDVIVVIVREPQTSFAITTLLTLFLQRHAIEVQLSDRTNQIGAVVQDGGEGSCFGGGVVRATPIDPRRCSPRFHRLCAHGSHGSKDSPNLPGQPRYAPPHMPR